MTELRNLRVAELGEPAFWLVGETLAVFEIVSVPPVKQCPPPHFQPDG